MVIFMKLLSKRAITKVQSILLTIIVIIGIVGVYYYSISQPTQLPQTIKIGFFAPLTGPASADGYAALNAALLAVSHINAKGGVLGKNLELVYYDDALNPDQAIAIARKLISDDKVVAAVSGSYSGTTLAASIVFNSSGIPLVSSYAVHPDITKNKPWVFRVGMLGEVEGKVAGYIAVSKLGARRIAVLYDDIPFGQTLASSFKAEVESLGANVVYYDKFSDKERDFTAWLTQIKAIPNLDLLAIFGYYYHSAVLVQARNLGITVPIIGAEGFDSPKLIELAGKAAEGVYIVTDLDRDSKSPIVQKFLADYKNRTGIEADMVAASAYDAVTILAKAIENAGSIDPQAIKNALSKIQNFEGVTGLIQGFTAQRNAIKNIVVQVVQNGKFHFYAEVTDPKIITPPY
jgi:branched-chain amino acid transport system substrate-binding protein